MTSLQILATVAMVGILVLNVWRTGWLSKEPKPPISRRERYFYNLSLAVTMFVTAIPTWRNGERVLASITVGLALMILLFEPVFMPLLARRLKAWLRDPRDSG